MTANTSIPIVGGPAHPHTGSQALHSVALAFIDTVARCGSIREAARQMNVSSSSITRQIQNVEHRLGVRLFERGVHGMRATPGGQIVIDHIRRTLRDLERTKTQIEAALGLRFGVVTIAATDSVASSFLPDVLSSFLEKSPGVRFKVSIQRSVDVFETVAAGQAEIGISFGPVVQKGLLVAGSYPLSIGVLVASDHPLAVRESVHIADVVKYPMAIPSSALPLYEEVVNVIRNEVPDYAPWIETDSMDLIKRMVETVPRQRLLDSLS